MRKLLTGAAAGTSLLVLTSVALADVYSAPRAYEQPFSWTGFYVGAQGGAGWGTSDDAYKSIQACAGAICNPVVPITPPGFLRDSTSINGFHGGGTIGFNWQTGPVVLGAEADWSAANIDGNSNCTDSVGFLFSGFTLSGAQGKCHTNLTSFGTVSGRLGVASGRALVFVKAGGAWGDFDRTLQAANLLVSPGVLGASASHSDTRWGFMAGAGIEYAIFHNWSAKVEYDFMDFGTNNETFRFTGPFVAPDIIKIHVDDREQVHVVRIGLNYRFSGDRDVPLK
jgi:outer membrane immunogenic protein